MEHLHTSACVDLPHSSEQWLCRSISLHGRTDWFHRFSFMGILRAFNSLALQCCPSGGISVGPLSTTWIARPIAQEHVGLCSLARLCVLRCPRRPGFPVPQPKDDPFWFVRASISFKAAFNQFWVKHFFSWPLAYSCPLPAFLFYLSFLVDKFEHFMDSYPLPRFVSILPTHLSFALW